MNGADDLKRRAERYRASLAAAGAAQPKPRWWRLLRLRPTSARRDVVSALVLWAVVAITGVGAIASLTRWGIAAGVVLVIVAARQLARVARWFVGSSPQT